MTNPKSSPQAAPAVSTQSARSTHLGRRQFLLNSSKAAAACVVLPSSLGQVIVLGTRSPGDEPASVPEMFPDLKLDLKSDPRRPQFHLLPAKNWMNDPNGPIYWNGHYHMYFQYNPNAAIWGDMHWYHSVSPDMIHWKHLPIALAPTPGGPDADGCFSGTAVIRNGVATFIYTGVKTVPAPDATLQDGKHVFRETQLYATSTDPDLLHWTKRPTPVIDAPPKDLIVTGFRDPSPWYQESQQGSPQNGVWYMAVGSGIKGQGGAILLYKSPDLQAWEYQHMLFSHDQATSTAKSQNAATDPVASGDMWECPDFFALNGKHVLIYSTQGKAVWQTGELDEKAMIFHPQQSGILDYGSFYAPKTQLDKAGNRILWGWLQESRPDKELIAAGWAGMMSLPRVLTVGADGRLKITAESGVDKLRKKEQKLSLVSSKSNDAGSKEMISSQHLQQACGEILCILKPSQEPFSIDLLDPALKTAVDPGDQTVVTKETSFLSIRYSHANPRELVIDQQRLPINLASSERLQLHFYIDGSAIELFINNQITITKRFYYPGKTAPEIALTFTGNKSDVTSLSLWQLTPISKDRLTT